MQQHSGRTIGTTQAQRQTKIRLTKLLTPITLRCQTSRPLGLRVPEAGLIHRHIPHITASTTHSSGLLAKENAYHWTHTRTHTDTGCKGG